MRTCQRSCHWHCSICRVMGVYSIQVSLLTFRFPPRAPVCLFRALPGPAVARLQVQRAPWRLGSSKLTPRCYWALAPSAYARCRIAGARRPPRLPRSPRPQCPPPAHPGCCSSPEGRVGRPQKHSPPNSPGIGFGLGSGRVRVRVGAAELALRQPGVAFKLRLRPVESSASSGALYRGSEL